MRPSRTDRSGVAANALDGPVGTTSMARRHVLGHRGVTVIVIAAGAQMCSDALAFEKGFDGARRQPHLDFAAGEAIGDAVGMRLDLDVVIDADAWAFSPRA